MTNISFLIPSLFPPLIARMIESIHAAGVVDYEIVVCSPSRIEGENVVWVKDRWETGCDPAIRQAFMASSGEIIMVLPDDHIILPDTLPQALRDWNGKGLMDLNSGWKPRIFGMDSVCFPLCTRTLVWHLFYRFFPYIQHFGDHSFALAARQNKVPITQSPVQCLSYPWEDRKGCGQSPTKTDAFAYRYGKSRIFLDFPDYSQGWEEREDFNAA